MNDTIKQALAIIAREQRTVERKFREAIQRNKEQEDSARKKVEREFLQIEFDKQIASITKRRASILKQ